MRKYPLFLCLVSLAALTAPLRAQTTISIPVDRIYAAAGWGEGGGIPHTVNDTATTPPGTHVEDIQPASWLEYRVTCTNPGWYTFTFTASEPSDPITVLSFESRVYTSNNDNYVTRYATVDSKDYGQFGSGPPNTPPWVFQDMGVITDPNGTPLAVPLVQGDNIVRIQNVSGRHNPATSYPPDESDPNDRPSPSSPWSNFAFISLTLTRLASPGGDLPALGTITGKVTGNLPAGTPVRRALVTANPTGQSPTELTRWWKNGWWTYTHDDGSYTIQAPTTATEVMAGRPSSYQLPGAKATAAFSGTPPVATANIQLTNLFPSDAVGASAPIQCEYFDAMTGNNGLVPQDGPPQNGYKMGWIDSGDSVTMYVDAPKTGLYKITSWFTNGGSIGHYRVSTDLGSTSNGDQPPGSWTTLMSADYPDPIYLQAGWNAVTQLNVSGNSDMDGVTLTLTADVPTVGLVQGTVTDKLTGKPVVGATVTLGKSSVTTNELGAYRVLSSPGTSLNVTVSAPFQEAPVSGTVSVTANTTTTQDFAITLRPHLDLSSANGYTWKFAANTGGAADFSATTADESTFTTMDVPSNFATQVPTNDIYAWYRLHFTLPSDFLTSLPGRMVVFRTSSIDDVDQVWVNGTSIGSTGSFPTTPLAVQPADYRNPPTGSPAGTFVTMYPGLDLAWADGRAYYFPASLLKPGDNVIAVKVFQSTGGAGITGTPYLEIAPATGTISGTVKVDGAGQAGIRVAAMDPNGVTSDWTTTAADGTFTLTHPLAGSTIVGAAKPGVLGVVASAMVAPGGTVSNLALNTTAVSGGPAPTYDDFTGTDWQTKWDALSTVNNSDAAAPTVQEPGVMAGTTTTIPGTVTVTSGTDFRSGIMSKARFSKYASVNAARLVSALPQAAGGQPNVILQLYGNPTSDDPKQATNDNNVELDVEGHVNFVSPDGTTTQQARYMIWGSRYGNGAIGPLPIPLSDVGDVTTTSPLDLMIVRTGSLYDFYVNDKLIHSQNMPTAIPANHKIFLYSYERTDQLTWDWVKAGPTAASPVIFNNVAAALRIAGGIDTSTDMTLNVNGDTKIDLLDAVKILRTGMGL